MSYRIRYAYFSTPGKVRTNHEDNLYVDHMLLPKNSNGLENVEEGMLESIDLPVVGVFDGMGGESAGEMASFTAACTVQQAEQTRRLRSQNAEENRSYLDWLYSRMNRGVCDYANEHRIRSMGTTAACLLFAEESICVGNVGDSRIYRADELSVTQITTDQVLRSVYYEKPPLLQYIGMPEEEMTLRPELSVLPYRSGDRYLLCTDGVTDMLSAEELSHLMRQNDDPARVLQIMLRSVLNAGARDNATAILCALE